MAKETGNDQDKTEVAEADTAAEARALLRRASQLVAKRGGWTKEKLARDRHSHPVSPSSGQAVRFCVGGALLRAVSECFGVRFKVGDRDDINEQPWFAAYALANRYLGQALMTFLLSPEAVRVSEQRVGSDWEVELAAGGEQRHEPVAKTSWAAIVQTLNDHRKVKHRDIVGGLALAQLFSWSDEAGRDRATEASS